LLTIVVELSVPFDGGSVHFLLKRLRKLPNRFGSQELRLEAFEDAPLDLLSVHRRAIVARALRTPRRASVSILGNDRISTSAEAALQQTRKQKLPAVGSVQGVPSVVAVHFV
jgi:hypothetical protein